MGRKKEDISSFEFFLFLSNFSKVQIPIKGGCYNVLSIEESPLSIPRYAFLYAQWRTVPSQNQQPRHTTAAAPFRQTNPNYAKPSIDKPAKRQVRRSPFLVPEDPLQLPLPSSRTKWTATGWNLPSCARMISLFAFLQCLGLALVTRRGVSILRSPRVIVAYSLLRLDVLLLYESISS